MRAEHLYIHVPFCARRCVYCDFSIAVRSRVPVREYVDAVEAEWRLRVGGVRPVLSTVYLGGGTPSKLGADGVTQLLSLVRAHADLRSDAEITVEANPEDVTPEATRAWRAAGVNRISLGVQSFDDAVLRWMHRTHDAAAAHRAIQVLREAGIGNVSIDLIFAVPARQRGQWLEDLRIALDLRLPHVSVYGLTVEPHTPLGRWVARRDIAESPEEEFEAEYLAAHDALTAGGLQHYEVSNYGMAGSHSRHNWGYWDRRPYIGLGPSAHEFDGDRRRWNRTAYTEWLRELAAGSDAIAGSEVLTRDQIEAESLYLGLRTARGIRPLEEQRAVTERLVDAGWAAMQSDSTLRLTSRGWLRLDSIANSLTLIRSRS